MKNKSAWKSIRLALAVLVGMVIYAYGFQVTEVNLDRTREVRRQEQFVRILRALARPDIFEYDQDEVQIETPLLMPCPEAVDEPEVVATGPYMIITPSCADPGSTVQIEGFNFAPNSRGPLNFIPPSAVTIQVGQFNTNNDGYFVTDVRLPRRQPIPDVQHIRAITRTNVGAPHLTRTALDTWDKIVETVFLALLATTIGTVLAIPISFLAARNLMKDITSPLASVALSIMAWPVGIFLGLTAARWAGEVSRLLVSNAVLNLAGLLIAPLIIWVVLRWALPQEEVTLPTLSVRIARWIGLAVASVISVLVLFLLGYLAVSAGDALAQRMGSLGFLASFFSNLGDILTTTITLTTALATGAVLSSFAGRMGLFLTEKLPVATLKPVNLAIGAISGATLVAMIGAFINWLYTINNPFVTFWVPSAVGAVLGFLIAYRTPAKASLPVGANIYYVVRTVLNTLRSIEAFIMAIVFVVLVSTGPFAGVLALSLHTIASLAKLYSEQVEDITAGPLEAVKATGATRLQTIIYAVIPQIIPPYISFTMYRWDINVRMSTIIGFAGGGGIGFLLQQNINLLNYRAASVQMLAITIVVALMDYFSSSMREKVV